jgi:hypothetical protein
MEIYMTHKHVAEKELFFLYRAFNEALACLKRFEGDCASEQDFQMSIGTLDAVAPYCAGNSTK